ncbi:MAG: hypothetical protein ACRC20_17405 [Segniliparus sp.]|uniref:hypothetical protein n=1 Tax=Segniliparus sp. TaxID=2804064 RepID=UPI003F324095
MARRGTALPLALLAVGTAVLAGCERPVPASGAAAASIDRTGPSASAVRLAPGQLAMRPDGELFALLPTQEDFPADAFLTPSPADSGGAQQSAERKLPETDPPGCAAGNPAGLRASSVAASLASEEAGKRAVALSIGKLTAGQDETRTVKDWVARCGHYRTQPSFGGVEGDEAVTLVPQDSPDLGLDEIVSYEQRTTGRVRTTGSDQETDVDERVVTVFGQLRGVFVSVSWLDDQDRDLAARLFEGLVDRVRSA